jgi:hypothetical protein
MFRHNHISDDHKTVTLSGLFESRKEAVAAARGVEKWQAPTAGIGDKVQVMSAVSAMQTAGHDNPMVSAASFPPLHRTQERGTHSFGTGKKNHERPGRPPKRYRVVPIACILVLGISEVCSARSSEVATGSVDGTVKLVRGLQITPLIGATLVLTSVSGEGGEHQVTTDSAGKYTLDLPQGTYKMLLDWMGGECSEIHRASFKLDAGAHLTLDLLVMQCPIIDREIIRAPVEEEAEKPAAPQRANPMNVPLIEQTEKYQEQLIPAERNRWPEIVVSFGKYDNQIDEIQYFPLRQLLINPFNIPDPPTPLSLPATITVDRYTLRASSMVLDNGKMVFKATGQVLFSDGTLTTDAESATLSFSGGEPKIELNH